VPQTRPVPSEAERIASLSPVLLASADEELRFIHLNPAWERVLGWQPEDLAGSRIVDLVHAEDRRALIDAASTDGGSELSFECRMSTRDGRWCWISTVLRREDDCWYVAGRDTTERHERLSEAQRVAALGSFDMEVSTGAMWWSDQLYDLYGLDRSAFSPTLEAVLTLMHAEDRPRVMAGYAQVLEGDVREHAIDVRITRPDGQIRELHARSRPVYDEGRAIVRVVGTVQDVTDRRVAERRLAEREAQLRALVEQVPAIVYTAGLGQNAPWDYVSPQIETLLGYSPEEWAGRRELWWEALHPDDRHAALEDEKGSARPGGRLRSEYRLRRRDGGWVWVRDEATVIENEHGELRFQGVLLDITERKRAEADARAKHAQLQAIIDNSPLMIWAKDRDYRYLFANVEHELLGPADGSIVGLRDADFLSPELAEMFTESDREVLETGRTVQVEQRLEVHGRMRSYLVQKFPLRDDDGVSGVCGIAVDMTEREEREEALRSKVAWSFRIRNAIDSDRLVLHSQPIVELASGRVVQEEVLVRMLGDDDELIMPGEFLPPAERFGLAPAIDRWVISRAAEIARERRVEVNLSAQSIGDPNLPDFVEAQLSEAGAAPSNLVFEITETAAADDLDQARRLAERLTELGCGFALDDFGTGYGSFTYLKHLPVRYIKIDMEFVRTLRADSPDRQVVSAIVDVARNFGIETIAEGVEAAETAELLAALGVHYAQGYHFGRPAPLG
jgi:PAS domain S-box-containing protein